MNGRRIKMERGDVILTPTWNWHDHGKDGSGPMIWLDGLDLPNFVHFPVHFVEHYQEARYPAESVDTLASPIVFPWSRMKLTLDSVDGDWISRPYLKANGSEGTCVAVCNTMTIHLTNNGVVSKTLGGLAERLNAGKSSPAIRETASSVYHVIEGRGYSVIEGKKFEWKKGDTFCVPAWCEYQHFASTAETVYLYRFDDSPMLKALGFYRTSSDDVEGLATPH